MKLLPRLSAWILAATATTPAHSSTAYEGELHDIHFMSNGVVLVTTTGSRSTAPTCATVAGRFAFDSTTPAGRSQLAGLIAAEAADRRVVIRGSGACTDYADSETIEYFYIVG
jgi:hypothetical protein